ncbi:FAD-dependent oxidoreductase [Hydrogenophaga sp. OTU3427]|uniref:FAD-dependent oxidoreductase n=1 Tax=Hydrogenophaga sp. OTU3427 TaxID=3043856 RepID=UPI00313C52D6
MAHIGIAGAGLLGRLLAWRLHALGHRVEVFDPAAGPGPRFHADGPTPAGDAQCAGFSAAGMLSPLAELDNAEPALAALGWRSIGLWRAITAALPRTPMLREQGSLLLAHRQDLGAAQRVLDRLAQARRSPAWRAPDGQDAPQPLDAAALRALEPAVHGPAHAWHLPGEGQIDPVATLLALVDGAPGVGWHWGRHIAEVHEQGVLVDQAGEAMAFEHVLDVRGCGARPQAPVRGVRGETVWLHAPGVGLRRPLRLLHPRHRVYLVPRPDDVVVLGASEIESEDRSPVSLKSAVELMAAAHSVVPALAEARILRLDVNLRPAYADHAPRIEHHGRRLRINGLFRHGWLLAPALVEQALREAGLGELCP